MNQTDIPFSVGFNHENKNLVGIAQEVTNNSKNVVSKIGGSWKVKP